MVSPGLYDHFKGGRYEVTATVKDAGNAAANYPEHLRRVVLYRDLDTHECYARPLYEFAEEVAIAEPPYIVPRFKRVSDRDEQDNGVAIVVEAPVIPGLEAYVHGQ